jgi:hypothetical protein
MWKYDKKSRRYSFRTDKWTYIIRRSGKLWILHLFKHGSPKLMKRTSEVLEYRSKRKAFEVATEDIIADIKEFYRSMK